MRRQGGALLRWACVTAAACGAFAALAGATTPSSQDFSAFLVQGYDEMARQRGADDPRASYFYRRATLAAQGGTLLPADPDKRVLHSSTLREADFARRQLLHRLDAGARQKQPLLAAIAQVNFDCWVASAPSQSGSPNSDECRRRFYFAFAGLSSGGSDVLPEDSPDAQPRALGPTMTASASDPGQPAPPATRRLILTPRANLSSNTAAGKPTATRLADANGSEPRYEPEDQSSLGRLIQSLLQETGCNPKVGNCVPLSFTGPSADLLIRDLRDGGPDGNGAAGGDGVAGDAAGSEDGNGKGKGNGRGNSHGKGPG
jgi:hypothetical protein